MLWDFIFFISLFLKDSVHNTTKFPFDIGSKQKQFIKNPIIIIGQINLGKWVCDLFPAFQAHGKLQRIT
jgi:hypothetical protein